MVNLIKFDNVLEINIREKTTTSIYDFQYWIPHFQVKVKISHCLITISINACSFAIFDSAVLSNLCDCNCTRTQNHLVCKRTLNHLWLSVRLRTKWGFRFEYSCSHLNFRFLACFEQKFLDIQATKECGFTLKPVRDMTRTYSLSNLCLICQSYKICLIPQSFFQPTICTLIVVDVSHVTCFFFPSGFSFTNIHESQDCRRRGRAFL